MFHHYFMSFIFAVLIFIVVIALYQLYILRRDVIFEKKLLHLQKDEANTFNARQFSSKTLKDVIYGFLNRFRNSIKAVNNNTIAKAKQNFEKCGWDSEYAEIITPIANIFLIGLFIASFFTIYFSTTYLSNLPFLILIPIFMLFAFIGYRSYEYIVDFYASIRIKKLERDIPMVIDLLSICTESGLNFDRSLEKVAQEIVHINYQLSRELSITSAELSILPDRRSAYNNMFRRIPIDVIRSLSVSMVYAEQHGISVNKTLNSLAEDNVKKFFYKIEAKAGKLPAKMTVPIILFSIPIIISIIIGPAFNKFNTTTFFAT